MHQLFHTELGRAMGLQQAGVHQEPGILTRLGVLHLVKQDCAQQYGVDAAPLGFPADRRS